MAVALGEWVGLLEREYLARFIAAGGAAVKIAVVPEARIVATLDAVAEAALLAGYPVAGVYADRTHVERMDHLFHAVARQMDWDGLAERWLRDRLAESGIGIEPDQPLHMLDAIAEANGRRRGELLGEINRLIANNILRDYALAKEFRTAAAMLCHRLVNPQNVSPSDADVIKAWLCGERVNLTALKRVQIFGRIGRHNARLLLASLARWLSRAGYPGLVLLIDLQPVVADPQPDPEAGRVRYSRNAVLDTYEVLRQCIDETDETSHLLLVAVAGPNLVSHPRRGLDNYTALKLRTSDEVRDRERSNPLSALVRLESIP